VIRGIDQRISHGPSTSKIVPPTHVHRGHIGSFAGRFGLFTKVRLRVRLRRARLPALDTELTEMMVEVLIHQRSPFRWR
jgi:hypothetical protein